MLEGETGAEAPTRQLSDVINGLLVLAQTGLSDQKMREQLQPDVREAYLEMLKSADVSQIDRGETKSVRLIFDLTPGFSKRRAPRCQSRPRFRRGSPSRTRAPSEINLAQ